MFSLEHICKGWDKHLMDLWAWQKNDSKKKKIDKLWEVSLSFFVLNCRMGKEGLWKLSFEKISDQTVDLHIIRLPISLVTLKLPAVLFRSKDIWQQNTSQSSVMRWHRVILQTSKTLHCCSSLGKTKAFPLLIQ